MASNITLAQILGILIYDLIALILTSKEFWIIFSVLSIVFFLVFVSIIAAFQKKRRLKGSAGMKVTAEAKDNAYKQSSEELAPRYKQTAQENSGTSPWERSSAAYIELDDSTYLQPNVPNNTQKSPSIPCIPEDTVVHTYNGTDQLNYSNPGSNDQHTIPIMCDTVAEIKPGVNDGDVTISITLKGSEVRDHNSRIRRTESDRLPDVTGQQYNGKDPRVRRTESDRVSPQCSLGSDLSTNSPHAFGQSDSRELMTLADVGYIDMRANTVKSIPEKVYQN